MELHFEGRVAEYEGDVEELASRYSAGFTSFSIGRADVRKYGLLRREGEDTYLFMISNATGEVRNEDYNVIASVLGTNRERTTELMEEWDRSMGIDTRPAPECLKKGVEMLKPLFYGEI